MSSMRSIRTGRSLTFISTLLLTTALAAPAFAQIEEVVVTAQKRAEDVQTVPIAISAFTSEDLKARQISQFKDLQFSAPNVTYTQTNFQAGADFQIRGIGITAVGYDSESGVAVNQNEVYLNNPIINEGSFYDLSGVEVLAGPQSTLYGRGATGGAVNINFAKPDTETFGANAVASYGNYDAINVAGMVNIPIVTDQLAVRVAGNWVKRDGFVTNLYDGDKVDGRDDWSFRGSARWTPTSNTTIDISGQVSRENDNHLRSDKQLCTSDPTGVLGCVPGSAGTEPVNPYATLSTIASSQQGLANTFGFLTAFGINPSLLGLYNLAAAPTVPPGYVDPSGARQIDTDFTPQYHTQDDFLSAKWEQKITPWLTGDFIGGYDHNSVYSQESYNNIPGDPLPTNNTAGACLASYLGAPNINCASAVFLGTIAALGGPAYEAKYAPYFSHVSAGELPISSTQNLGITGGDYTFTPNNEGYDQSDGRSGQYSAEARFTTNFTGPLNAMIGGYYLRDHVDGDYYVNATTLDYPAIVLGGILGAALAPGLCITTGCIYGPSFYHNYGTTDDLNSKAVYGEVYYDIIPDLLKITGGLRYTEDEKYQEGRIELFDGFIPIGTTNETAGDNLARSIAGTPLYDITNQKFFNTSGHVTLDWTPKLDFTDQTLVYASFSRGYKAGGANPGIEAGTPLGEQVPALYAPEFISAYELGTKNQLLQGTLQANGDVYYYDYTGLQVSEIEDNTSVNQNVDAKLYGVEGNLLWAPDDRWQFNLNFAGEHSSVENANLIDIRNPTGGDPNTLLVKDDTISANSGSNCVLYYTGAFPGLPAGYTAPAAGVHALASQNVANVAFGSCDSNAAAPAGYSWINPATGKFAPAGVTENLDGNELQNTPDFSISAGVQYTYPINADYNLVGRIDDHYQASMWGRIFEDGADRIGDQNVTNASVQLNALTDNYYVQGFIKNIFNANSITGEYLTSPTSGLYTNAFYGDPRTYGVEIGAKF